MPEYKRRGTTGAHSYPGMWPFKFDKEFAKQMKRHAYIWSLIAAFQVGCGPTSEPPPDGVISLKFEGLSDADLTLALANGLEKAIQIQGERTLMQSIRVWPPDAEVSCRSAATPGLTAELGMLGQGTSQFVVIAPGEHVKLHIQTKFPQRYTGGRCSVSLHLKDGTNIGPVDFRPQ